METISEKESPEGSMKLNGSTELVDGVEAVSNVSKPEKLNSNGSLQKGEMHRKLVFCPRIV